MLLIMWLVASFGSPGCNWSMNDCARLHGVVDEIGVVWYKQLGDDDMVVEYMECWGRQQGDETAMDEDAH